MATIGDMFGGADAATFLGVPARRLDQLAPGMLAIMGVPTATPYASAGAYCAGGPAAMRKAIAPYSASRHHMDFDLGHPIEGGRPIVDLGDLPWDAVDHAANRDRIRAAVGQSLAAGAVPVILGGDDSVPIPVLEAYKNRGPINILQIDAHIDWRDEVGGERWGLSSTMRRASEMGMVKDILQVGQRAIGSARPADFDDAKRGGARFIPASQVHRFGIEAVLGQLPKDHPLFINLDVDALDPAIMPAVIGPAPGGLTYAQVTELLHRAAAGGPIAGFAILELMPDRDADGLSALTAARLVCNILGLLSRA